MENSSLAAGRRKELLNSYEQERRPVAESLLHLSTRLLETQKQGGIKRERDVRQLDIQYIGSPLNHTLPERQHGLQTGEELLMRLFWALEDNHYGYFSCYKGRNGICWPTKPTERSSMRGEVCVSIILASRTNSSTPWGTSGSPINWCQVNAC